MRADGNSVRATQFVHACIWAAGLVTEVLITRLCDGDLDERHTKAIYCVLKQRNFSKATVKAMVKARQRMKP